MRNETMESLIASGEKVYQHPFLLADAERLETLKKVGGEEPWKSMKEEGLKKAETTQIRREYQSDLIVIQTMYDVINYNMLGYMLDAENAEKYKTRVLEAIAYFDKNHPDTVFGGIYTQDGDNWNGSVPPGNTFAVAVVALDILYPSLTEEEIASAEAALQCVADAFWAHMEAHCANTWGVRGIWAAYRQDWGTLQQCWDEWQYQWHDSINSDGGQLASVEYAYVRYAASERNGKILLPYIMEYMGLDDTFFSDEQNKNAMEHLLGYTYAPNGEFWIFGDTKLGNGVEPQKNLAAYIAPKYSDKAAGYGAFAIGGDYGAGNMLKLLLGSDDGTMAEATAPPSRIYDKTGAFFYENHANKNSLAGVMYNQTKTATVNGHSHSETNAIGLYAYGNMLMANAGYAGFNSSADGYSWKYIQNSAVSANTVLINYEPGDIQNPSDVNDHNNQWNYQTEDSYGKGIVNGFTNDLLCYAKGESGNAIANGSHARSFVMVASQDEVPGYFIEFDDVCTEHAGDTVTVIQRPLSVDYETVATDTEYEWTIANKNGNETNLSVFLVNEPEKTEFWDGIAASTGTSVPLKSLFAKYASGDDKNVRIGTVLFPWDENHPKAEMKRVETAGANGAKLAFGNGIADYVFTSEGGECTYYISDKETTDYHNYDRLRFQADNVILRKNNGINAMYFAQNGTSLLCGEEGFEANRPVTVFMKNNKGTAETAEPTAVTFYRYGVAGVSVNGEAVPISAAGEGKITVTLPQGTSEIELVCDEQKALTQMLESKIANECFADIKVLDSVNGKMLSEGKLTEAAAWEENETVYVSAETAEALLDGKYSGSTALRLAAEAKGYTVLWHSSGLVFLVPQGERFDFDADAPNLGLALRIFAAAVQTETVTNTVPQVEVLINGTPMEEFDPCRYRYTVPMWEDAFDITAVSDMPTTVEEKTDDVRQLTVYQGKRALRYTFCRQKLEEDAIVVTASAEPQADNGKENVLDGDLNTRWSAEGSQWLCFTFAERKTVNKMQIAWYMGDQRVSAFNVEISDDGKKWTTVFDGGSSGTTTMPETVDTGTFAAKYVRVNCNGTSVGSWNSPAEVIFDFAQ